MTANVQLNDNKWQVSDKKFQILMQEEWGLVKVKFYIKCGGNYTSFVKIKAVITPFKPTHLKHLLRCKKHSKVFTCFFDANKVQSLL